MLTRFHRVLVTAPHTDDGEIGAGGTIARLVEAGAEVYCLAFSTGAGRAIKAEFRAAMRVLGVPGENLGVLNFKTRYFPQRRQDVLQVLIRARDILRPDLVLCPSARDAHQDHQVVAAEAIRAFRATTLLGYELPWNGVTAFDVRCFVSLEAAHLRRKLDALYRYKSQSEKAYTQPGFITGLARMRGVQAGVPLAEAFEVVRWVMN